MRRINITIACTEASINSIRMAICTAKRRKGGDQLPGGSVSIRVPALLRDKVAVFLEMYEDMALQRHLCLSGCEGERRQLIDDFKRIMDFEKERLDQRREIEDRRQQSLF